MCSENISIYKPDCNVLNKKLFLFSYSSIQYPTMNSTHKTCRFSHFLLLAFFCYFYRTNIKLCSTYLFSPRYFCSQSFSINKILFFIRCFCFVVRSFIIIQSYSFINVLLWQNGADNVTYNTISHAQSMNSIC